jgi:hypothetical protein
VARRRLPRHSREAAMTTTGEEAEEEEGTGTRGVTRAVVTLEEEEAAATASRRTVRGQDTEETRAVETPGTHARATPEVVEEEETRGVEEDTTRGHHRPASTTDAAAPLPLPRKAQPGTRRRTTSSSRVVLPLRRPQPRARGRGRVDGEARRRTSVGCRLQSLEELVPRTSKSTLVSPAGSPWRRPKTDLFVLVQSNCDSTRSLARSVPDWSFPPMAPAHRRPLPLTIHTVVVLTREKCATAKSSRTNASASSTAR